MFTLTITAYRRVQDSDTESERRDPQLRSGAQAAGNALLSEDTHAGTPIAETHFCRRLYNVLPDGGVQYRAKTTTPHCASLQIALNETFPDSSLAFSDPTANPTGRKGVHIRQCHYHNIRQPFFSKHAEVRIRACVRSWSAASHFERGQPGTGGRDTGDTCRASHQTLDLRSTASKF